jgi:L-fuculose-phosphate aldolase
VSARPTPHEEQDARTDLTNGIRILERLGIIDFNGHFSVRLDDGNILINSGSSVRSAITPDDFVLVGPNGETDPDLPSPPKELALHLALYQARPDVRSVVHGHPKWSTLLTSAGKEYRVTMAQGALLGEVPVFGSPRSVNNPTIAAEVAETVGSGSAALLKAHGSVVVAGDVLEATVLAIYLELNAERQYNASLIGEPYVFSAEEITACRKGLMKRGLFEKCWNFYLARQGLSD